MRLFGGGGRGDKKGSADEIGLVLFDGEFGARRWREAVCVIFAEGIRVLLFEGDGHTGAPGTTGVASVCEWLSGRPISGGGY